MFDLPEEIIRGNITIVGKTALWKAYLYYEDARRALLLFVLGNICSATASSLLSRRLCKASVNGRILSIVETSVEFLRLLILSTREPPCREQVSFAPQVWSNFE